MPGGRDGRWSTDHVESDLDEPIGPPVCSIHGTWLTPVATRTLAGVRHAADFGGIVQQVAAAQAQLDDEPACAGDAQWLQGLCTARTAVRLPWGRIRPHDLIRIVDAVARAVIAASDSGTGPLGLPADRRQGSIKSFTFEFDNASGSWPEWPTCCDGRPRNGCASRLAQLHRSSGWHRCAIGPTGRSHGSVVPQRPRLSSSTKPCDGSSASRPGTSRHVRPCWRRSSDLASRLGSDALNEAPFADHSFRVADYSFKVEVIAFFGTCAITANTSSYAASGYRLRAMQ